ncbi:porin [Aquincola sp. S2]|uniref:Porin n=1 Tax=Pseudaquabacterium terrae TaxID=2732868 RepID=A0ABX2EU92_9BURK|nr:porin [Aquabacterium terrae]NRF72317.1 porin [Aquabacterium terrae]
MRPRQLPLHAATAMALSLATGAAWAQSSVNVSGYLSLGVIHKTGGPTQLSTIERSSLVFSGTEDLGGGLAATFRLSHRFDLDTGTVEAGDTIRPFWKGESTVGLKGSFGAIRFGRALTPLWAHTWTPDPWYGFNRVASQQWWLLAPDYLSDPMAGQGPGGGLGGDYARINNGVFYDSPTLGGFRVHLAGAIEKRQGDLTRNFGGILKYDQGSLNLFAVAEQNSQKDKVYYLGGAYQLDKLGLGAWYSHGKLNPAGAVYGPAWTNWAGASNPTTKRSAAAINASYSIGLGSVRAGWGKDFQGSTSYFNYVGATFANAGTGYSGPSTMISAGYLYNLSKRTSVFTDVARVRWAFVDDNGRRGVTGMDLGITHSF